MRRRGITLIACMLSIHSTVFGLQLIAHEATWPKEWPEELEEFRSLGWTASGPHGNTQQHYIRFESREQFERAWPALLRAKPRNENDSIRLVWNIQNAPVEAHVCISEHPFETDGIPALVLAVDGEIVDLNRIPLPGGVTIIDERFPPVTFEMGAVLPEDKVLPDFGRALRESLTGEEMEKPGAFGLDPQTKGAEQ